MSRKTSSFTQNSPPRGAVHAGGKSIGRKSNGRKSIGRRTSHYLLGAALSLGLSVGLSATHFGTAEAAMIKLGKVDVQIDTTMSVGATMLTKDRETQYLPLVNGGPADEQVYIEPASPPAPANCVATAEPAYGAFCQNPTTLNKPNFDGSINTDDGRLNFDKDDIISAPAKLTSEIEAQMGAFRTFARINAFYDTRLMDEGSFERGGLDKKGRSNAGRDLQLLDLYVDYDGDVGNMPFTIRAGRQVINWGEATFIPGGNSAFSPIDVAAIRRPGAEIKEALLPVEALYGSLAITDNITVEAYVGGWEEYKLDAGGTAFGGSDAFTPGSTGGNPRNTYYIGGGGRSGQQFACDTSALRTAAGSDATLDALLEKSADIADAILATGAVDCANNPNMDVLRTWTTGKAEQERFSANDTNKVQGLANEDGDASAGLAVRWYAENLNSTEFAFYYQKVDSRLPYVSYRTGKAGITASSTSFQTSTVGRGAGAAGCGVLRAVTGGLNYTPAYAAIKVNDEYGLLTNEDIQDVANEQATSAGYTRATAQQVPRDSIAYFQETVCLLAAAQVDSRRTFGSPFDNQGQLPTGATNLQMDYNVGLFAEYPEVEIMGFSFNTTAFGWGVQGDFTFRPEMPLQFDTDSLTIAALFNNCAFTTVGAYEGAYLSGSTYANEASDTATRQNVGCTDQDRYMQGYTKDHDAYTWDIGTTATFTRSNPVVSLLGAGLGILLTEFQGVVAEDIEEMRGNTGGLRDSTTMMYENGRGITPLTNVCQGGSDLPLNGILSIDDRTVGDASTDDDDTTKGFCRPTDSSFGAVLFAQLQYNNVFGTPIALRPTFVYTEGLEGYSPSPLGFWREGVGSASIRLDASYLDAWQYGLAYTAYHGDIERTRNLDRDTLSLNVSYAF